jgi:LysM repeat protein
LQLNREMIAGLFFSGLLLLVVFAFGLGAMAESRFGESGPIIAATRTPVPSPTFTLLAPTQPTVEDPAQATDSGGSLDQATATPEPGDIGTSVPVTATVTTHAGTSPATSAPSVSCGPPAGWVTLTIKSGDTLFSLAQAYGVTVGQLQIANCLGSSTIIVAGKSLFVPNVSVTNTPLTSPTPTRTKTPTPSNTPTTTNTPTLTPTFTPSPSYTPSLTPSETPIPSDTSTPTETPTPTTPSP